MDELSIFRSILSNQKRQMKTIRDGGFDEKYAADHETGATDAGKNTKADG